VSEIFSIKIQLIIMRYVYRGQNRINEQCMTAESEMKYICEYNSRVQYFYSLSLSFFTPYVSRVCVFVEGRMSLSLLFFLSLSLTHSLTLSLLALNIFLTGFWSEWIIFIYFFCSHSFHSYRTYIATIYVKKIPCGCVFSMWFMGEIDLQKYLMHTTA
jgi:hypothetical protein